MSSVLYVYAITRDPVALSGEAIDGSQRFGATTASGISAVFTPVEAAEFSQEVIDRRAGDLEWLGAIGYRHQAVMAQVMKSTSIVPLRAFAIFSGEPALRAYLQENAASLDAKLTRLAGKEEWTLQVEFDATRWIESLNTRVAALRALHEEIETAAPGKAFLLRKKLQDEKTRASREAEQQVVAEIEREVLERLRADTLAETRERRDGAFPQINVLLNRDEEARILALRDELAARYDPEGVTLAATGPWPPYSFA
jgi:hypothetical protein